MTDEIDTRPGAVEALAAECDSEASHIEEARAAGDAHHVEWCEWMRRIARTLRALSARSPAPRRRAMGSEREAPERILETYDAGLFGDGGGGNVEWWHDYLRYELGRAHEHYAMQYDALLAEREEARERAEALTQTLDGLGEPLKLANRAAELEDTVATLLAENAALRERVAGAEAEVAAMRASGSWFQEKDIDRFQGIEEAALAFFDALDAVNAYNGGSVDEFMVLTGAVAERRRELRAALERLALRAPAPSEGGERAGRPGPTRGTKEGER